MNERMIRDKRPAAIGSSYDVKQIDKETGWIYKRQLERDSERLVKTFDKHTVTVIATDIHDVAHSAVTTNHLSSKELSTIIGALQGLLRKRCVSWAEVERMSKENIGEHGSFDGGYYIIES